MAENEISRHTVTRKLDTKAVDERLLELHKVDTEIQRTRSERAEAIRDFAEQLKPLTRRQEELILAIADKKETLEVECRETWDYAKKTVRFIAVEGTPFAGQEINSRPMDGQELQQEIGSVQGGKNKRGAAAVVAIDGGKKGKGK